MLEAVFHGGQISKADEAAVYDPVDEQVGNEDLAEGDQESAEGDTQCPNEGSDFVAEFEAVEVAQEHSDVGEDDAHGDDDGEVAGGEGGLTWVGVDVPW